MNSNLVPPCVPGTSAKVENKTIPIVTLAINIESLFSLDKKLYVLHQTNNTLVYNFFSENSAQNVIFTSSVDNTSGPIALKLMIPNVEFSVPEVSIDIPYYSLDCEDCIDGMQLKNCGFKEVEGRKCKTVLGIKKCVSYWYIAPTKCAGQLGWVKYTIPKQVYFFVPGFAFNASFFLITPFDMESSFLFNYSGSLKITKPLEFLTKPENKFYMSFTITKLQIQLTLHIKEMSFTYNNKTLFTIKDIEIPMFPRFDFCEGSNYISSSVDSIGNIKAYYLIKSITLPMDKLLEIVPGVFEKVTEIINATAITLVDMLGDPSFVEFIARFGLDSSQAVIKFLLRTTIVTINIGLLFCPSPLSPFWLSLVGTIFVQSTILETFVPQKFEYPCPITTSQFDNILKRFPMPVQNQFKTLINGVVNNFLQSNKLVHPAALDFARNFALPALLYHLYLPIIPKAA
jgi:hypothetical protein